MLRSFFVCFLGSWLLANALLWRAEVHDWATALQAAYLAVLPTIVLTVLLVRVWRVPE